MNRKGFILWQGRSRLDGRTPIAVIATVRTRNAKTGPMIQTWIIRTDREPVGAVAEGADRAICGRCPYRSGNGCYVNIGHAPRAVYLAFHRGTYQQCPDLAAVAAVGRGRKVRLGSYGDPVAAPVAVWNALVSESTGHAGYTHQWSWHRNALAFRQLVMASVDSPRERRKAKRAGWRTFRVKTKSAPRDRGEVVCPASSEAGKRVDCASCLACNGANGRTLDVVIDSHGPRYQRVDLYQLG